MINTEIYDEVFRVLNQTAFDTACRAALYAASEIGKRPENKGKLIVVIISSFGERCLSTPLFADLID